MKKILKYLIILGILQANANASSEPPTTHSVDLNSTVSLDMIWCPPGTFTMGSPTTEKYRKNDETPHEVLLTKGFYIGKFEVTQAQYETVMKGNTEGLKSKPSRWPNNPNHPVETVSWNDAQVFLKRLNEQQSDNLPNGWRYSLPSEAQWEYACRAGTTTAFSWGNDHNLSKANFKGNGSNSTLAVGQYLSNPWGIYDMHGNVEEWTESLYKSSYPSKILNINPNESSTGTNRVLRGGHWASGPYSKKNKGYLRSASRYGGQKPNDRANYIGERGFRISLQEIGPKIGDTHTVDLNSTVSLEMIWCPPGTFTMGSPTYQTEHNVSLTDGFYLGMYEVTQAQYKAVMTGNTDSLSTTPSHWRDNPNRPVEKVSWNDAQVFLRRLNEQQANNLPAGWSYVLPTESQWEYACRAGTKKMYSWGNTIASSNANFNISRINQTCDVGEYAANPWGFFDMHGNVWEWTADWYQAAYPTGNPVIDPTGPATGFKRTHRGGSWVDGGVDSTGRGRNGPPTRRTWQIGFRIGFQKVTDEKAAPDATPPQTGPGDAPDLKCKETIAKLETEIKNQKIEITDLNTLIIELRKQVADLNSSNLALTKEVSGLKNQVSNLNGQVTSLTTENGELTGQVTNLRQDNGNLQTKVATLTQQLGEAERIAKVPFVYDWIYTQDHGWLYINPDNFPIIYKNDTQSWHFYEQGSINPRYFYNFNEQKWEAWDPTE